MFNGKVATSGRQEPAFRGGAQGAQRGSAGHYLHGADAAVIISARDFGRMSRRESRLVDFFRKSPLAGVGLKLDRSRDTGRKIGL